MRNMRSEITWWIQQHSNSTTWETMFGVFLGITLGQIVALMVQYAVYKPNMLLVTVITAVPFAIIRLWKGSNYEDPTGWINVILVELASMAIGLIIAPVILIPGWLMAFDGLYLVVGFLYIFFWQYRPRKIRIHRYPTVD